MPSSHPSPWFGPLDCCTSRKKVLLGCRRSWALLVAASPAGYSMLLHSDIAYRQQKRSSPGMSVQITQDINSSHVQLKGLVPRKTENKMSFSKIAAFTYHFTPHRQGAFHSCTKPSLEPVSDDGKRLSRTLLRTSSNREHTCVHPLSAV